MSDTPPATTTGGTARSTRRPTPNYAARRMLVTTIGITAIVALAIAGWRIFGGDDRSGTGTGGDWDEIALIDRSTGAVTVVDDEGETVSTAVGLGRVTATHVHGERLALVGDTQIVVHGIDDEPVVVPVERGTAVTPIRTTDTLHLAVGRASGGNVLIVDVDDGSVIDVGALVEDTLLAPPLMFVETLRWNDDASMFAIAEATSFQTIVVGDDIDGAVFLSDQPVAVGDELVATGETVGRQADVALVDLERRRQAIVPAGIPAGGMMLDDTLLMVSVDGEIVRVGRDDEEAERLGLVTVPAGATVRSVAPVADGDRLLVAGSVFAAVIDLDGNTVFTTTFTTPIDVDAPRPGWVCVPIGGDDSYHSLIAVDGGEQLADLTGLTVTGVAGDGCTVIGERAALTELVTADDTVPLGQLRAVALGPDGRTLVWTTTSGTTELIRIGDELELAEPIELPATGANLDVAFLDR